MANHLRVVSALPEVVPTPAVPDRDPLWRQLVGDVLRRRRRDRGETLGDVARRAGVSPQYLSEVERGRKEPSSEVLRAVGRALDLTLRELVRDVAGRLDTPEASVSSTLLRAA